ncbi:MAG: hypothetical protein IJU10_05550, partial [Clostridia bacterium]|nr:hypothetical protein [Clostridia bacterium]
EELAELINFDNVTVSEEERQEAMQAEDINVLTYGKEQINDLLNDKLTPAQLEQEMAEAVPPVPEVGEVGYEELGQDAEEVTFELDEEAEAEEAAEEAAAQEAAMQPAEGEESAEEPAAAADATTEGAASADDEWSFIDSLQVETPKTATPATVLPTEPEDRENVAVSRAERKAYKQRLKAEKKAKKEAERARREQEKKERKERMRRLEEENKKTFTASYAPTSPRPKKNPNPYTPTAEEILAPKPIAEGTEPPTTPQDTPVIKTSGTASAGSAAGRPRTFVPRSYTPISITPENVHEVLGDGKDKKKKK